MYTRVSAMVILVVVSILHSIHLSMVFTPKKYFFLVLKATDAQYAEHSLNGPNTSKDGFNCKGKDCEDIADAFLVAAYVIPAVLLCCSVSFVLCFIHCVKHCVYRLFHKYKSS